MPKLIFLNGCINSGKTTVANRMKFEAENLAHVEVDELNDFISWMPLEKAIRINLDNAASVSENLLRAGINVVVSYPLSKPNYEYLLARFADVEAEFIPITLFSSIENVKRNRGGRVLSEWELDRIDWMYANGLANPGIGRIVDNSSLSIEETVEEIIHIAGLSKRMKSP